MGQRKTRELDHVFGRARFLALCFQLDLAPAEVPGARAGDAGKDQRFPTCVAGFVRPRGGFQLRGLVFGIHDPDLGQGLELLRENGHAALKHRLDRLFTRQYTTHLGEHLGKPRALRARLRTISAN